VQYLAPIIKNRQYNMPPIGTTLHPVAILPLVNAQARPNEVTYSEDWLRPDFRPAPPTGPSPQPPAADGPPLPAEAVVATDPAAGLPGMMIPPGAGR
jgi:phospholipid/cholesterol/gamma-HCH transport system substrate-binding protein